MSMLLNKFDLNKFQFRYGMIKIRHIVYFHMKSNLKRIGNYKKSTVFHEL